MCSSDLGFEPSVHTECDVYARVIVRVEEMIESLRLIEEAAARMPAGPLAAVDGWPKVPAGEATVRIEAPRGEVIYHVVSDGGETPARVKIRTPSFVNIPAIEAMVPGQQFADLAIIQASVDPCISCTDR